MRKLFKGRSAGKAGCFASEEKMVCPVLEQAAKQNEDVVTEYPYEPLYRPWSWTLSTFSNFLLLAVIVVAGYALYRRRWKGSRSGREASVSYRRVDQGGEKEARENALVLGAGTGFGQHLVRALLADGSYNVHYLDSYIPYREDRERDVCSYMQADIASYEDMLLCTRGMKVVFHASNLAPHQCFDRAASFHRHNVTGTENVVRVCRETGVKRLVYTSSAAVVVGNNWNRSNVDETAPYPASPRNTYLASLAAAERLVLDSNGVDGLATCVMRLAPVIWSPDDPLVKTLLSQSVLVPHGVSHNVTAVDPDSAAGAHITADRKLTNTTDTLAHGKVYNLGNNTHIAYHNLVGSCPSDKETSLWGHSPPTDIPKWTMTLLGYLNYYGYKLTGNLIHCKTISPLSLYIHTTELTFSSARARQELGWSDDTKWQDAITSLVEAHKTSRESKKEQ